MKTLKDTATLVALILLALTVRVDTRDPSPIDVSTPAHAATKETPVWQLEPEPQLESEAEAVIETVRSFVRPTRLERVSLAPSGVAAIPQEKGRQLVWELDGKRVVTFSVENAGIRLHVLRDEESVDPPSPPKNPPAPDPAPCDAHRARISC